MAHGIGGSETGWQRVDRIAAALAAKEAVEPGTCERIGCKPGHARALQALISRNPDNLAGSLDDGGPHVEIQVPGKRWAVVQSTGGDVYRSLPIHEGGVFNQLRAGSLPNH